MSYRIVFSMLVFMGFLGCRTTGDSALKEDSASDRLSGTSYCRAVGSLNGSDQVKTCLEFGSNGSGTERDTSGGIPRNDPFSYSISGSRVTIVVSDSPLNARTRDMTLASDGSTLTFKEGSNTFVWALESESGSTDLEQNSRFAACHESGTVSENYVIERLSEEKFKVTASAIDLSLDIEGNTGVKVTLLEEAVCEIHTRGDGLKTTVCFSETDNSKLFIDVSDDEADAKYKLIYIPDPSSQVPDLGHLSLSRETEGSVVGFVKYFAVNDPLARTSCFFSR